MAHSDHVRRKDVAPSPGKARGHDMLSPSYGLGQPRATGGTPAKKLAARQSVGVSHFYCA